MKIKSMPKDLRPRERLLKQGPAALSTAELLAIILRTGNRKESALDLAIKLLKKHDLMQLSSVRAASLKKEKGIGETKACQIISSFELGRRLASFDKEDGVKINSAEDIARKFMPELSTLKKEHFMAIYIDPRNRIIREETITVGTLDTSIVHPREIFQPAILEGAAALILLHNHPSGDPEPSNEDIEITKQLIEVGKIMGIEVIDHIIIGCKRYCSLRDRGCFS